MLPEQRKIVLVTSLGKKYSGFIDIPNIPIRTTDLLNSSNIYWKNPNEKCYDNALMMHNVQLYIDESSLYKKFDKIQVKLSDIFYFYDDFETISDEKEKNRASILVQKSHDNAKKATIITREVANSFYDISGVFFGLFKKKSHDKFIALTEVHMIEILKKQDKWVKKEIKLPHKFIGFSTEHIESIALF